MDSLWCKEPCSVWSWGWEANPMIKKPTRSDRVILLIREIRPNSSPDDGGRGCGPSSTPADSSRIHPRPIPGAAEWRASTLVRWSVTTTLSIQNLGPARSSALRLGMLCEWPRLTVMLVQFPHVPAQQKQSLTARGVVRSLRPLLGGSHFVTQNPKPSDLSKMFERRIKWDGQSNLLLFTFSNNATVISLE